MNVRVLMTPEEKARELQRKLYLAAKANSNRRFHALYDKVYRDDFIREAWRRVKANKGAAGVDGQTIEQIEDYGEEQFIRSRSRRFFVATGNENRVCAILHRKERQRKEVGYSLVPWV